MAIRIGIVGFGRIGRNIFRQFYDRPGLEFAAVCDSGDPRSLTYLLNQSTIEGKFCGQAKLEGNHIVCGTQKVRMLQESAPGHIPWDCFGVDVVLECTGHFRTRADMEKHIEAGAKAVVLSTPALDGIDGTFIRGVNCGKITGKEKIISCGSSSVQALALMAKVLDEAFGIEYGSMTTVHAYTGDQRLSDTAHPELRWSRSAAQNIIPNVTWAPEVVGAVLPRLAGKIKGLALNVPVSAGSNIDLVTKLAKPQTLEEISAAFKAASEGDLKGLLSYTEEPIVSSDAIRDFSTIIYDSTATLTMAGGLTKTLGWFDNGWAYAARMMETAQLLAERRKGGA